MDSKTGLWKKLNGPLKVSEDKRPLITQMIVSEDGKYFACCDN